ncbi:hypothetical protein C8R48DRAFT_782660 [Suillus tomentosus]|nr:hypothetical protein C8R48DRAFT_782660 [Suillus tomentosus]
MLIKAAEHAVLYKYSLVNAQNHYIGFAQTGTPYYQHSPAAPAPNSTTSTYNDSTFSSSISMAWGMYIQSSNDIIVFGAGFYSFFQSYSQDCLTATLAKHTLSTSIARQTSLHTVCQP